MVFKRLHLGTVSYGTDTMDEIQNHIVQSYAQEKKPVLLIHHAASPSDRTHTVSKYFPRRAAQIWPTLPRQNDIVRSRPAPNSCSTRKPSASLPHPTSQPSKGGASGSTPSRKIQTPAGPKVRKSVSSRIHEAVKAIALCHNVTPVYESHAIVNGETESAEADQDFSDDNRTYQASSPDEEEL
ncbi:putative phospholipid-transporting ATPase IIB [Liparis tanakae]|uniref:Putative phospholipid-transporting ATPase IIB n=1 Tax=Liparis tanakae TaxID=230148 RepID=A0A4Z2HVB8_9TELE|nr:putative phospholipid-transporting ATPase IIB [Liparis tanakae]